MQSEPHFATDLYRGTAEYYDRYRLTYPRILTEDIAGRVRPSGHGLLLDLACGTGQLAFALHTSFAETWAVDQEPDMVRLVAAKATRAAKAERAKIRPTVSSAEDLSAPAATFELITIGNAFHRLHRQRVARRSYEWLRPGGHLALCWSSSPWSGDARWQQALGEVLDRWRSTLGARDRVPPGWDRIQEVKPHLAVLTDAGFEPVSHYEVQVEHGWSVADLAGLVYSTSFLAAPLFGDRAAEFETDLAYHLEPHLQSGGGVLVERVSFGYDLARKPSS